MQTKPYNIAAGLLLVASLSPVSGCAAETALAVAPPVNAANGFTSLWQPGWQCGQANQVSRAFIDSLIKNKALHGYALNGVSLPLLLGQNPAESGAILFAKSQNTWRAYPIADGSAVLSAYSTPAFNRLMLFATWGRGGPSNDYILLHGKNQLSEFGCTSVHFPAELNRPDWNNRYPGLHDFNMDTQGRGSLVTAAYVPAGNGEKKQWYQYTSNDWGRNWSEGRKIPAMPAKLDGIFQSISEIPPPTWLVKSLLASTP
ncbi:hypothetical protein SAMN05660964_00924 [Thiothrix caldifontis]|uniref:BNR repeat-like domain-containing protein n=1 Tax=Thiothrix caldifontis TaxID=525918 RepID=A0A1H3YGP9_9GAMM|nr:hypothetical protein [Thiothrix caldifontis]SEA10716.1 hypothetical protein SAMN05660964_00924 [Thiothrix caldifontis]